LSRVNTYLAMKQLFIFFLLLFSAQLVSAQDAATTHAEFTFQGKTYTANYDEAKHLLTMSEEVSIEIYDETGTCIKRSEGTKVDFKPLLKVGEDKTFTVKFYKKSKTSKRKKKNSSIKQKGEIGIMVIRDQK
jgi:hypothetical protein